MAIENGQVTYGPFSIPADQAAAFAAWCIRRGYDGARCLLHYQPGSREFGAAWLDLADELPACFNAWQYEYVEEMKGCVS